MCTLDFGHSLYCLMWFSDNRDNTVTMVTTLHFGSPPLPLFV